MSCAEVFPERFERTEVARALRSIGLLALFIAPTFFRSISLSKPRVDLGIYRYCCMVLVILLFLSFLSGILTLEDTCSDNLICIMAQRERTFIMIKPDGVQRGLIGKIISRFEEKGFKLVAMKFMQASQELLEQHYAELAGRPFFAGLVNYMQLGPVVPMVWEGLNIVKTARDIIGATNPMDSLPGTLRGDLCVQVGRNIIHGSDSLPSAEKEISLWFTEEELANYSLALDSWINEGN